jgi:hypothetical protein
MHALRFAAAVLALLLAGTPASALVISYASDADFLANAAFVKDFGANVRWGNGQANGDWEYSVVDASDLPLAGGNPKQHDWQAGANLHDYLLDYDSAGGTVSLALSDGGGPFPSGVSSGAPTVAPGLNALAIRARANFGDAADLYSPITVVFDLGGPNAVLGPVVGDGDAEYLVLVDARLAGGFQVFGAANLQDGSGSLPQYGFKVGHVAVPEPAACLLLLTGVAGGLARRRAREHGDA